LSGFGSTPQVLRSVIRSEVLACRQRDLARSDCGNAAGGFTGEMRVLGGLGDMQGLIGVRGRSQRAENSRGGATRGSLGKIGVESNIENMPSSAAGGGRIEFSVRSVGVSRIGRKWSRTVRPLTRAADLLPPGNFRCTSCVGGRAFKQSGVSFSLLIKDFARDSKSRGLRLMMVRFPPQAPAVFRTFP